MEKKLTKVALRYRALFLGIDREDIDITSEVTVPASAFVAQLRENGFCVSEELLHALNAASADTLAELTDCVNDVMGVNLNWASLVKGWDVPTGESCADHIITWIANICGGEKSGYSGTPLRAGTIFLTAHSLWSATTAVRSAEGRSRLPTSFIKARAAN